MFGAIFSWLSGGVVERLTAAYMKAKDSAVESERTRAGVLKAQLDNALEAQRLAQQVRLATAGFWEMRVITALIALPFVAHLWLVGLDTCFALGWRIAAFPQPFADWQGVILLSFFGVQIGGKAINAVAAAFIARRT
jgi:hypothetical protein